MMLKDWNFWRPIVAWTLTAITFAGVLYAIQDEEKKLAYWIAGLSLIILLLIGTYSFWITLLP